jgi:aldehyde dehydrogenase (NAD+)
MKHATPAFLDNKPKKLLIGGEWSDADSGKMFESVNPSTGLVIAHLADGGTTDISRAVGAARRAFEGPWRKYKPFQRQNVLLKLADLIGTHFEELSLLASCDMGAPLSRAARQKHRLIETLRYNAGWATKIYGETIENSAPGEFFSYTIKEPVGVVGAITPWNGPLVSPLEKIGPALASGCTVVLKPSEDASLCVVRLAELMQELDLPPGVINVITGAGEAGGALAAHPDVDKINFTGSHVTGQKIVRASADNMKRLSMELGGKSPDIVFADADWERAVPGVVMGALANTGQMCMAGSRLFVQEQIYDEFVAAAARFVQGLRVGHSLDPATELGPIASRRQFDRVMEYIAIGKAEGARTMAGAERLSAGGLAQGFFVAPTLFADVQDDMRIAREEIFGPVLSALRFRDTEEVIHRANATEFGLGAGVWTNNVRTVHQLASAIRSGTVWVNCYAVGDAAVPFGGYKLSGYGKEKGLDGLNEYLTSKTVWIRTD